MPMSDSDEFGYCLTCKAKGLGMGEDLRGEVAQCFVCRREERRIAAGLTPTGNRKARKLKT